MKKPFAVLMTIASLALLAYSQNKLKTPREYFLALPDKYFSLDCCYDQKPARKAKEKFLKQFVDVEDNANGYIHAFGDAAQDGMAIALFKRPDGSHMIGFYDYGEGGPEDTPWTYFFYYKNGRFTDVSRTLIKGYDKTKYIYELPRQGTTVTVYAKDENGQDWYKGAKLYELEWKGGKFVRR